MNATDAKNIITEQLFIDLVHRLEARLSNHQSLKRDVFNEVDVINNSLADEFNQIVTVLQAVVDKYFFAYYEVPRFVNFSYKHFDE